MDKAKHALDDAITEIATDLERRNRTWNDLTATARIAQGQADMAEKGAAVVKDSLRIACTAYLALIEGKVLMSDHPCKPYEQRKGVKA